MKKDNRIFIKGIVLCCLAAFCFSLAGCEPLRKKFTRKKKEEDKRMVDPVLEPIDYPPMQVSPEKRYKYHYSMWRIWQKDFLLSLGQNENEKRSKYLLTQVYNELQEMDKWIVGEKNEGLHTVILDYDKIQNEMQKPQAIRDMYSLMRKLESNDKKIRHDFSPEKVAEFLAPAP